ncbi:hypothetical protein SAMN05446037_101972 [Anaerovirgula multivorans]|uniref:Uncharacterized protein n=1 Tax=Anaerovirgula multivorans TaxID=312168 RepID=A0A239H363_9FIRM|nr:hypothetical protein [Anaerovirgula multivorans]SNS75233.1 hypothetical protein SAMN05446037_101972 [Anaerovirgula multivorans]
MDIQNTKLCIVNNLRQVVLTKFIITVTSKKTMNKLERKLKKM